MDMTRKEVLRLIVYVGGAAALGCGTKTTPTGDSDSDTTPDSSGATGSSAGGTGSSSGGTGSSSGGTGSSSGMTGSSSGATGPFTCAEQIGTNHGHEIEVTDADIVAAANKQYHIQGTSAHDHTVSLSAADFATLASGGVVMKTSSNGGGHTHDVTIMCAQ